ncbi:MAG: hypothetical protein ABIB04_05190 [Patescibacteria group bacterium]
MRYFNLFMAVILAPLALATSLIGGALALALLIILLPFMAINYFVHERCLHRLDEEEYEDEMLSEEFGERMDLVGAFLRIIPLLPLFPAFDLVHECSRFLEAARRESTPSTPAKSP